MPSPVLILALLLAALLAGIYVLSTLAREVPTQTIEVDVTNVAGR